jgi:SAM-dependent methyltransferase
MQPLYDTIGIDYAHLRREEPRIAAAIHAALSDAQTVINVGAGTGSYEPRDWQVTAVEPSAAMIAQRPADAAPAVRGSAEHLPFADKNFDAAMAVLTIHHWQDQAKGLAEMRRVAKGPVVLLTFDPAFRGPWLHDYFPELVTLDERQMPPMDFYEQHLGEVEIRSVPIPHDCIDGFLYAYWRRPAAYLDPRIRAGSSSFWKLDGVEVGLVRLSADLESGAWEQRYGDVMALNELDCGYRLVVARG